MYKIITHSGSFHADDVFAVASLQLHLGPENVEIVRTRDDAVIQAGDFVVDVGGVYDPERNRFDHHQNGVPDRENGLPYAAFGLVWKHIGEALAGSVETAAVLERRLVLPIDAGDNGVSTYRTTDLGIPPFTISDLVASFRPAWGSHEDADKKFMEATGIARAVLQRAIAHANAELEIRTLAQDVYDNADDTRVLILDRPIPSAAFIDYADVRFVVCPDDPAVNTNWSATAVRVNRDTFTSRIQFPNEWAGLRGGDLAEVSGIPDAIFCHKARFIFVAGSKAGALAAVAHVLERRV